MIQTNWTKFLNNIDTYISGERGKKLKDFYLKHEERFVMMPASHKPQYHNCFPGGYIDHVNRVVDAALQIDAVWRNFGMVDTYTTEELVFSAINHDLGKFGDEQRDGCRDPYALDGCRSGSLDAVRRATGSRGARVPRRREDAAHGPLTRLAGA